LIQLAELLGASSTKTCFFSQHRLLAFEVLERRGMIVPVPQYAELPENDGTRCFVKVNFADCESLYRNADGAPGALVLDVGSGVAKEIRDFAGEFVEHLCACLRVQRVESEPE
jgi:hypothetical protein